MVERVSPPETEVLAFTSFDAATRALGAAPPDAAVVSITTAHLPWREFRALCAEQTPPVPVLLESCIFASAEEAGLEPQRNPVLFLHTPAAWAEFERAVARLLTAARRVESSPALSASA